MDNFLDLTALADIYLSDILTKYYHDHNQGQGTSSIGNTAPTGFSDLLFELRTKIWKLVSQQPRNLCIYIRKLGVYHPTSTSGEDLGINIEPFKYNSNNPHPAVLHICRESRVEGLKIYKLSFGTSFDCEGLVITSPPRTYIN